MRVRADAFYSCDFSHVAGGRRHGDVGGHLALSCAAAAFGAMLWMSRGGLYAPRLQCALARAGARQLVAVLKKACDGSACSFGSSRRPAPVYGLPSMTFLALVPYRR